MKDFRILFCLITFILMVFIPANTFPQVYDDPPESNARFTRFSETSYSARQHERANDPMITAMVNAVNADTLRKTLQQLQDWGSRCLLNDNHKDVAIWLMNKFLSYGYTDVKLDSFYLIVSWGGIYIDTSWQYNVVCILQGASAPEEIYVIGGHYDTFTFADPLNNAPGVDDNGTSVAATLEIARVMADINYQPETTIHFTLFSAEELGLFGSRYASQKARLDGRDIRYMFNIDMIANNPDNIPEVKIYKYPGFDWACHAAAQAIEQYTDLSVVIPEGDMNTGSDSYPYWLESYPSIFCQEIDYSPYIHTIADTLGNCNVPYFTIVTGGALATLAEQQILPFPQKLTAKSTKEDITLQWMPTNNAFVRGYNIYRSDTTGSQYQKITPEPVDGSIYHDLTAELNKQYYYVLTTVNDSLLESGFSGEVTGARFNFCDTLLALANLKLNQTTPDSVFAFYQAVLDTIPFVWFDINSENKINLALLSRYRYILLMSNNSDYDVPGTELAQCVTEFINNGGNLIYAGFNPSRFWMNNNKFPVRIPDKSPYRHFFKVDSADRKIPCMLYRANSVASGYNTLNVDTLKYMDEGYPGNIYNIEVFSPEKGSTIIYRFDTKFDSASTYGRMKHRPVGLEYMGTDFKSILLSFPLYYMDTTDARDFLHYVMSEKFTHPVGMAQAKTSDYYDLMVFPNPVTDACNIIFTQLQPGRVKLTLISMQGKILNRLLDCRLNEGTHRLRFNAAHLDAGLYQIVLQSAQGLAVKKIIRIK